MVTCSVEEKCRAGPEPRAGEEVVLPGNASEGPQLGQGGHGDTVRPVRGESGCGVTAVCASQPSYRENNKKYCSVTLVTRRGILLCKDIMLCVSQAGWDGREARSRVSEPG